MPNVPQYACGAIPTVRKCPYAPPPDAIANVVELTGADVYPLMSVVARAVPAALRMRGPVAVTWSNDDGPDD